MKKLLILPRERYKSPPSKYRSSRHIKGSTRLAPMNQYGTDSLKNNNNNSSFNNDFNKIDPKVSTQREDIHSSSFDSSLQKIPPLIIPPKEKNTELTGKRLEFHKIVVENICACELQGILKYALECISQLQSVNMSQNDIFQEGNESSNAESIFAKNKLRFIKGEFTPKSIDPIYHPLDGEKQTILNTFHTIDSQNYLHFTPELIYKSLSNIFNVEISENHLCDPNPILNAMIDEYQNQMIPFLSPFCPYKPISFPFIVGVGGPPSSGKTTVCQFLQKAFTVNIIHINYITSDKNKNEKPPTSLKKTNDKPIKKTPMEPPPDSMMITELILQSNQSDNNESNEDTDEEEEYDETEKPPPYYPLPNAYEIDYSDDKSTVNSIVTLIQKIMSENNTEVNGKTDTGFIIDGFPNNKNQYSLLEKALASKNVNMHEKQIKHMLIPPSQRARAQMTCIDGIIITACTSNDSNDKEKSANSTMESNFISPKKRFVDPETGNIYSPNFHMPGLSDLIGISPPFFAEKRAEIEKRLEELPLDDTITQKAIQKYTQFEATLRKSNKSLLIENCTDSFQLLEILDEFIQKLYKNVQNLIPALNKKNKKENCANYNQDTQRIKPMITLLSPSSLIKPELTFTAMSAWSQCIEVFGRPISDQSQLVTSISEKVETLQKVATERYQLLISQKDERIEICSKFIDEIKNKLNINNIFGFDQNDTKKINEENEKLSSISISSPANKSLKTKINPRFKTIKNFRESEVHDDDPSTINLNRNLIDMKKLNDLISNHFRQIWDSSISIRSKNMELIDDLVNKCGLIELILEFRKSPKKYFIFLVHRMIYVKWFFDNFSYIYDYESNEQQNYPFFEDLKLRTIDLPQINYQLSKPPSDIKSFKSMFSVDSIDAKNSKITSNKSYMLSDHMIDNDNNNNAELILEKQPETSRPIDKNENHCLAKVRGFKYLEESLNLHLNQNDDIYFDSKAACNSLGILNFTPSKESSFETETLKYAEEFFNHVFVSFESKLDDSFDLNCLLANEAKIGLQFFRKFATACRRKEASMVSSVFDLKDSLNTYANSKTTREMEKFSKRFRAIKSFINGLALRINEKMAPKLNEPIKNDSQSHLNTNKKSNYISPYDLRKQKKEASILLKKNLMGTNNNNNSCFDSCLNDDEISYFVNLSASELFEYDVDLISDNVKFLADLSLSLKPPFVMQSLLQFNEILGVADEAASRGQLFTNIDDFISNANKAGLSQFSLMKLELCVRVAECIESFDSKPFLLLFAKNEEEEEKLIKVFNKPPKPANNLITSSLSSFVKGLTATAALLSVTNQNIDEDDNNDQNEEEEEEESPDNESSESGVSSVDDQNEEE